MIHISTIYNNLAEQITPENLEIINLLFNSHTDMLRKATAEVETRNIFNKDQFKFNMDEREAAYNHLFKTKFSRFRNLFFNTSEQTATIINKNINIEFSLLNFVLNSPTFVLEKEINSHVFQNRIKTDEIVIFKNEGNNIFKEIFVTTFDKDKKYIPNSPIDDYIYNSVLSNISVEEIKQHVILFNNTERKEVGEINNFIDNIIYIKESFEKKEPHIHLVKKNRNL